MTKNINHGRLSPKLLSIFEVVCIIGVAIVPLFVSMPYRVNIFLSWEGAYRLYLGQVPFRDFGLPMGFAFWIIPAIFFHIFGPYLITLVKAQVFINILSGLAFRSMLKSLKIKSGIRTLSVLVFCLSFSILNFWPWYNQSVIVFEFIALSFLLKYILRPEIRYHNWYLAGTALFVFIAIFTKQDAGGMTLLISVVLLAYHCYRERSYQPLIWFMAMVIGIAAAVIIPFLPYHFTYWFNYGQPPNNSRLSVYDITNMFFSKSQWLKFYFLIIGLILMTKIRNRKDFFADKSKIVFTLITLGILAEAVIYQVTSYTPPNNNIFFHSFAFAYILCFLNEFLQLDFTKIKILIISGLLVIVWWSRFYWDYLDRIIVRMYPESTAVNENEVSIRTFMLNRDTVNSDSKWIYSDIPAFKKVYLPASTVKGMDRLLKMDIVRNKKDLKVLNMSELTPLAWAIPYRLEKGDNIPLWYHQGVGMFKPQTNSFISKINSNYYDLVLFEYLPGLNNFFPFSIRSALINNYRRVDSFLAPRRDINNMIEVYIRK